MMARTGSPERQARPEPPVTAAWLERVALHYLDRYGASTEMLRRVLARRVERRCRAREEDPATHANVIDEVVARSRRAGLVDDARFAAARLRGLRRRGTSTRQAQVRLAAKGIDAGTIAEALAEERDASAVPGEGGADTEERAAQAYARRRRLGPYRRPGTREAHRDRDLAAMARAGFSYGLARAVIGGEGDAEALTADED
ncbi:MAG: RecX family transcriptional regulator [Methylorubrum populi]